MRKEGNEFRGMQVDAMGLSQVGSALVGALLFSTALTSSALPTATLAGNAVRVSPRAFALSGQGIGMQQRRGGGWPANKGGAGAAMMRLRGGRDIPIDMKIMDW
jgi:hypothetical protein